MGIGTDEGVRYRVPIPAPGIGTRISAACERIGTRKFAASEMGISVDSLARYIREENMPPFDVVARLCAAAGVSMEWLATGDESAKPLQDKALGESEAAPAASQSVRTEDLTLAVQLAEEALEGRRLEPADYAQLVMLIHSALVNGLPSAQVLAFARPASRGLRGKDDGSAVGGSGQGAAGAR